MNTCQRHTPECPLFDDNKILSDLLLTVKSDLSVILEQLGLDDSALEENEKELSKIDIKSDIYLKSIIAKVKDIIVNQRELSRNTGKKLQESILKLEEENSKLKKDKLTGLFNRQTFDTNYIEMVSSGNKFSIAIIDIDDFKIINDSFGHPTGDAVLKNLSILLQNFFPINSLYRFGGEEFIILISKESRELLNNLNNILTSLNKKVFKTTKGQFKVTFSGGVKQYSGETSFDEIYSSIDQLLYKAKKTGKNKVEIG